MNEGFWNALGEESLANLESIRVALERDPDLVHSRNVNGESTLQAAIRGGSEKITKTLLDFGADARQENDQKGTLIHFAVWERQPHLIPLLWRGDCKLNSARQLDGLTPLMCAAKFGDPASVRALIDCGAKLDLTDPNGRKAIDIATEYVNDFDDEIWELIEKHGIDEEENGGDSILESEKVFSILNQDDVLEDAITSERSLLDRGIDFFNGFKWVVGGVGLIFLSLSQAFTGWINDALWSRILYGVMGTLVGLVVALLGIMLTFYSTMRTKKNAW